MHLDSARLCDPAGEVDEEVASVSSSVQTIAETTTSTTELDCSGVRNCNPVREFLKHLFILEPAVFLIYMARNLSSTVFQNQLLYQSCVAVFRINASDCEPLLGIGEKNAHTQMIEVQVEPYVTKIMMVRSLLEGIVPAVLSLFIGSWSDKFGRRPVIITTITAALTSMSLICILSLIPAQVAINPWIFLIPSIPLVLSGGTCAMTTGVYSYISDMSEGVAKARRMIFNDAALGAGTIVGGVFSGYIYAATNCSSVFGISAAIIAVALAYVYFCATESLSPQMANTDIWSKFCEFFHLTLVRDLINTCCKQRPRLDRAIIWMTMLSLTIVISIGEGETNVNYFFVRNKFNWSLQEYNWFNAERAIIQVIGCIVGLILLKRVWKVSIITMALIASACNVLESTVRATATYSWELYLGIGLGLLGGIISSMSRAVLSYVAPALEVGKIFALTISLETLSPLAAAPLYTMVYNLTLERNPSAFNYISAGLYLICYTFNAIIMYIKLTIADYQKMGI